MFGEHFYHKQIRNTVIAFGTIFNNINIKRLDSSGNPLQNIRIPLSYSPKEKFIARLDQNTDLTGSDSSVAITLPRMAFDITGYAYDSSRKLNKNQKIGVVTTNADTSKLNTQYSPVPYDVSFELNVFTATSDDGLQIIEQILPYFQPDYTVTMIQDSTYMDTKRDIPFILESVNYDDSYTGTLTSLRRITYTLSFTAKIYLYGPISTSAVIKTVSADLYTNTADQSPSRSERVTVTPNPTSADKDDTYTYTTTLEFFDDGKNYDEVTGDDK
ncbi:MAG: tail sheath stabilizer and completion protein [Pelagibacteraceae bacterium]|nr:tail sheath stabilizer and completion protein [Pelagibacteraceae bacterium]